MRRGLALLMLIAAFARAAAPEHVPRRPRVVRDVDLARVCAGTWHEIARIPTRFQQGCACCVTARYVLREDGVIEVVNRCVKTDGSIDVFEAEAEVVDTRTRARWKLAPFKILGFKPVKADMWIIGLAEDFGWLVFGTPDRDKGWVLARDPDPPSAVRAEIEELLVRQGYAPEDFVSTPGSP
jgi:apolipoprotein D and lipocalin family protein